MADIQMLRFASEKKQSISTQNLTAFGAKIEAYFSYTSARIRFGRVLLVLLRIFNVEIRYNRIFRCALCSVNSLLCLRDVIRFWFELVSLYFQNGIIILIKRFERPAHTDCEATPFHVVLCIRSKLNHFEIHLAY